MIACLVIFLGTLLHSATPLFQELGRVSVFRFTRLCFFLPCIYYPSIVGSSLPESDNGSLHECVHMCVCVHSVVHVGVCVPIVVYVCVGFQCLFVYVFLSCSCCVLQAVEHIQFGQLNVAQNSCVSLAEDCLNSNLK